MPNIAQALAMSLGKKTRSAQMQPKDLSKKKKVKRKMAKESRRINRGK